MGISLHAQQNLFIKGQITENQQKTGVPFALVKINDTYTYADLNGYFEAKIPSADEVEEEGVLLGEMQRKTIEKIEELTLYIIEQHQKIEELSKEIQDLKLKTR